MSFLSTFGRLPKTGLNLFLKLISGVSEGVGISLFIPLLHLLGDNNKSNVSGNFEGIFKSFQAIGFMPGTISLLTLIAILSILAMGFSYLQSKVLINAKARFTYELRERLFRSFIFSNWKYSSRRPHGEVVSQIMIECNRAGQALGLEVMAVATMILILIFLGFSLFMFWHLTLIAGIFGAFLILVVRPFSIRASSLGRIATEINKEFSIILIENLRALKLFKVTANEDRARQITEKKIDDARECAAESELIVKKILFLTQALPVLFLTFIIGVSTEILNIPISATLVFLLFMIRIAPRVVQFQQQLQGYNLNIEAFSVVENLTKNADLEKEGYNISGKKFKRIGEAISLDKVSFSYIDGDGPAIEDVSLTIKRNQVTAIVGSSGAGKSTIIDILTGLQKPDSGTVNVDGINLNDFNLETWRQKIGLVSQDIITFNASLRENLKYFRPQASDSDIEEAILAANLNKLVSELADGLDTTLGESGVRFSGGQRQRIALGRALLGNPELLLLDEATSALDNETERIIQEAIRAASKARTVVIIAHRLSTVKLADIIYVMEEGMVVEKGSFSQLLKLGGRFSELERLGQTPS